MKKQKITHVRREESIVSLIEDWHHIDCVFVVEWVIQVIYTPKTIPKEIDETKLDELKKIVEKWNKIDLPNKYKQKDWKQISKVRKITPALISSYNTIRKSFEYIEVIQWITDYLQDIVERTSNSKEEQQQIPHKKRYYNHRFTLREFFIRPGWLQKFINL